MTETTNMVVDAISWFNDIHKIQLGRSSRSPDSPLNNLEALEAIREFAEQWCRYEGLDNIHSIIKNLAINNVHLIKMFETWRDKNGISTYGCRVVVRWLDDLIAQSTQLSYANADKNAPLPTLEILRSRVNITREFLRAVSAEKLPLEEQQKYIHVCIELLKLE